MLSVYPLQILSRVLLVYKRCERKDAGPHGENKTLADAVAENYIASERIFAAYNPRILMRIFERERVRAILLLLTRDTCTLFTETSRGQRVSRPHSYSFAIPY